MEIGCIVNKMKTQSEKIGKLLLLKFKFGQMYILIMQLLLFFYAP